MSNETMQNRRKQIAIVTFLSAMNHGALLQAYALQRTVEALGGKSRLLDYSCPHQAWVYAPIHRGGLLNGKFLDNVWRIVHAFSDRKRNSRFRRFIARNLTLSPRKYYTLTDLESTNKLYDVFISGSDQVFSVRCSNLDTAYFLSFVDDPARKFSYAASFGFAEIKPCYRELYRSLLSDFKKLSLREESGRQIIHGLLGEDRHAEVHVDPTLLLPRDEWSVIARQSRIHFPRRYLLVYNVYPPRTLFKVAFKLAKKLRMPIVYLGNDMTLKDRLSNHVRVYSCVAPESFVAAFQGASAVLTNSFHGTVFSILFHHQFLVELENEIVFNQRSADLLRQFGLENRALPEEVDMVSRAMFAEIDWDGVGRILSLERDRSFKYLHSIVAE